MDKETLSQSHSDTISLFSIRNFERLKPYRKYQLIIFLLMIFFFYMLYQLYTLNTLLNYKFKTTSNLDQQLYRLINQLDSIDKQSLNLKANYYSLYQLTNDSISTDIIRNIKELNQLQSWIINEDNDNSATIKYSVCYKATIHGDKGYILRDKCKGLAPNVILIETTDGYRFGAFTTKPWMGDNKYLNDKDAFIFSLDTLRKYGVGIPERAAWDCDPRFPQYGENDIYLEENFLSNRWSYCNYPITYKKDPNAFGDYMLTGGLRKFQVKEVEMLIVYITPN